MYHLYNLGFRWWARVFLFSGFNALSLQNRALTSCLSSIWQTLPTGSLAGSSSLTQPLKGEENVMCCVQEWFVAEEGLRTATLGGEAPLPPCSSGSSLQSSSSVQEYARVATPKNKREEGFSNRLCSLDWLCYQHTDAAFCVGCERLMPQTSYFLPLNPLFPFSSHPLHLTLCSNSTQSSINVS